MKRVFLFLPLYLLVAGCGSESRGFVLPEGSAERGKTTFQELSCTSCHSVGDVGWQGAASEGEVEVPLGRSATDTPYGELVTSIINPSHRIARSYLGDAVVVDGESKMLNYNGFMTVQELIDVVAFLETEYRLVRPTYRYEYRRYCLTTGCFSTARAAVYHQEWTSPRFEFHEEFGLPALYACVVLHLQANQSS